MSGSYGEPSCIALVAEDHPLYMERVTHLLHGWGIRCVRAVDGREAIGVIERGEPLDLLITDLDMPHKTGWDVIDAWLAMGHDPRSIVMVTGEADSKEVQARCAVGGIALLHKLALLTRFEGAVVQARAVVQAALQSESPPPHAHR